MDFNEAVFKTVNTFMNDRYLIHCYITDETGYVFDKHFCLKGFGDSTLEQCLSNFVFDHFNADYYDDFNIVTDIVNKLVILTIYGNNLFRKITIDKIERIQDIEEE